MINIQYVTIIDGCWYQVYRQEIDSEENTPLHADGTRSTLIKQGYYNPWQDVGGSQGIASSTGNTGLGFGSGGSTGTALHTNKGQQKSENGVTNIYVYNQATFNDVKKSVEKKYQKYITLNESLMRIELSGFGAGIKVAANSNFGRLCSIINYLAENVETLFIRMVGDHDNDCYDPTLDLDLNNVACYYSNGKSVIDNVSQGISPGNGATLDFYNSKNGDWGQTKAGVFASCNFREGHTLSPFFYLHQSVIYYSPGKYYGFKQYQVLAHELYYEAFTSFIYPKMWESHDVKSTFIQQQMNNANR